MANTRALDKRRKSIRNIRKITRTMELISTARFKKAMDRATEATAYTDGIARLVRQLARQGMDVAHPLLDARKERKRATLLLLTANRGLCGGYNGGVIRLALQRREHLSEDVPNVQLDVSGKRGITALTFRRIEVAETFTQFGDSPTFDDVEAIANRYLNMYASGRLDRLEVVYTRFVSIAHQEAVVETLAPLGSLGHEEEIDEQPEEESKPIFRMLYEYLPSTEDIINELVPASFKMKLFKCFLDAAVSEQIARMVAMKAAADNANEIIRKLSMTYNRARQSQITNEITEIIGGVEALEK